MPQLQRKTEASHSVDDTLKSVPADPLLEVVPTDKSADTTNDGLDTFAEKVSTDQPFVPVDVPSTQMDKGKSIMVEQDLPSRKKSKQEIANEKLSEQVAAQLQAAEFDADAKRAAEMKESEALARKIQADLDKMSIPISHSLPAERQKELDEISKHLTAEHWTNLATQVSSNPDLSKSILGDAFHDNDYAEKIVEAVKLKKKAQAERKAKEKRDKPSTKVQIKDYMRIFVCFWLD